MFITFGTHLAAMGVAMLSGLMRSCFEMMITSIIIVAKYVRKECSKYSRNDANVL